MAGRRRIKPELRAAALADLLAGDQPAIVAERHGIDPGTVRSWKTRFVASDVATGDATKVATKVATRVQRSSEIRPTVEVQKAHIGETILDLLRAKLQASQAIAEAVADPAWLQRQSAAELAALGQWLDGTAFAIGDRLASGTGPRDDTADD